MIMKSITVTKRDLSPYPVQRDTFVDIAWDWLMILDSWFERSRQRRALAKLDDRLRQDVGISNTVAAHEIAKPFWR